MRFRDRWRRLAIVTLGAAILLGACATSTPRISEEEHCPRFGGLWERSWQGSWCRHDGGGSSM
jgi:hypothetical protein